MTRFWLVAIVGSAAMISSLPAAAEPMHLSCLYQMRPGDTGLPVMSDAIIDLGARTASFGLGDNVPVFPISEITGDVIRWHEDGGKSGTSFDYSLDRKTLILTRQDGSFQCSKP